MPKIEEKTLLVIGAAIVVIAFLAGGLWFWQASQKSLLKACTMEAKLCPDGSSVGRTGLNCEFAPCPSEALCEGGVCSDITKDWQTYRNEKYGFEVGYPPNLVYEETDDGVYFADINEYKKWREAVEKCEGPGCELDSPFVITISFISDEEFGNYMSGKNNLGYKLAGDPIFDVFMNKKYTSLYNIDVAAFAGDPCRHTFGYTTDLGLHWLTHFTNKSGLNMLACVIFIKATNEEYANLNLEHQATGYEKIAREILSTFKFIEASDLTSCKIDADCACGVKIGTNECFFGNKKYVNTLSQCPDFCSGIDGGMIIKCQANKCVQVREKYY